ncbi:MAG: hypothetical protein JKY51_06910 [Opitutaceae bacterium]|nr:hypothetical protein [Opitutaceae bacterium]
MLNLLENKSKTWFKILTDQGEPIDGSPENWSLPFRQRKGDQLDFSKQQAYSPNEDKWNKMANVMGTWLVNNPKELYPSNSNRKIFIAELLSPPSHEILGIIWVHKVRLVREATNMDLKRFGIYRAFPQIIDDD